MAKYQIIVEETVMKTLAIKVPDKVSQEELQEWCNEYKEDLFYAVSRENESVKIEAEEYGIEMDVTLKEELFDWENYGLKKEASNVK